MRDPAAVLRFEPSEGTVIRTPPGTGYGHWVGGHKAFHDRATGDFVIFYRERTPLEHGRGGVCRVARSVDGLRFDDVWEASKHELAATSIEVGHCIRAPDGEWRLYLSYEFAGDRRWRIDLLRGTDPGRLDTQGRRTVLAPADFAIDWIKDPWIHEFGERWTLVAAAPPRPTDAAGSVVSARPLDATVVAESEDGVYFPTIEYVFEAEGSDTWHGRRARLNGAIAWDEGVVGFYDGGRTFYDNYEEWAGLAVGPDLRSLSRHRADEGPWVRSPHGSVRYIHPVPVDGAVHMYYEFTRPDGSHDLRVSVVPT